MRSPEGENETSCTQPPLGLENSPQTVLNGNFSPQTVGSGLTQISAALTPHPHAGKYSLGIDALDKRGKHARPGVGRARGEQDVVGVPVDREHGRSKRLFEVLRSPPVVFFIKGADGDGSEGRGFSGDSEYGIYRAAERCFRGMDDVVNLFGGTEQARIRSSAILAPLRKILPTRAEEILASQEAVFQDRPIGGSGLSLASLASLASFELLTCPLRSSLGTHLAPFPTANLSSLGLHLTHVAALLILNRTKTGFHSPCSLNVQT